MSNNSYYNDQWRIINESNQNKVSNYSCEFDGTGNDFVDISTIDSTGTKTYSCWINPSVSGNNGGFLTLIGVDTDFVSIALWESEIHVMVAKSPTANNRKNTVQTISANQWYHIVVVKSTASVDNIYINGVNQTLAAIGGWNSGNTPTQYKIGDALLPTSFSFSGKIDQVSIFDYALPATGTNSVATLYGGGTAVTNPMALSPKPIAAYQLGDQSVDNGANYLVPNNSLQDYVFNFTQGSTAASRTRISIPSYILTQAATVSLWVKFDLTSPISVLLGGAFGERYPLVKKYPNNFQVWLTTSGASSIFSTNTPFSSNTWFHIAITQNSSSATLYINGEVPSSGGTKNPIISTINTIGNNSAGGEGHVGQISNVSIFNTELPATGTESITSLYNNGSPPADISSYSGLQRWYKLNAQDTFDGSNWTIKDYAGSNDGTSFGMDSANLVQSDLQHTSGYSPYALRLDGTSNSMSATINELSSISTITTSLFININSSETLGYAFQIAGNNGTEISLGFNNNKLFFFTGVSQVYSDNQVSKGVWHNVVITRAVDTQKMYINGVLSATATGLTTLSLNSLLLIGKRSNGFPMAGDFSNLAIWSSELSTSQITSIYNEGVPTNLNTFSTKPIFYSQLGTNSSFDSNANRWTSLDEISGNNASSTTNMSNDDIVNGVGYSANGLGTSSIDIVGEAPYSSGNCLSNSMDVLDRVKDTPPT